MRIAQIVLHALAALKEQSWLSHVDDGKPQFYREITVNPQYSRAVELLIREELTSLDTNFFVYVYNEMYLRLVYRLKINTPPVIDFSKFNVALIHHIDQKDIGPAAEKYYNFYMLLKPGKVHNYRELCTSKVLYADFSMRLATPQELKIVSKLVGNESAVFAYQWQHGAREALTIHAKARIHF